MATIAAALIKVLTRNRGVVYDQIFGVVDTPISQHTAINVAQSIIGRAVGMAVDKALGARLAGKPSNALGTDVQFLAIAASVSTLRVSAGAFGSQSPDG